MTKKQLPAAVAKLRQRVTELEAIQARQNRLVEPLKVNQGLQYRPVPGKVY